MLCFPRIHFKEKNTQGFIDFLLYSFQAKEHTQRVILFFFPYSFQAKQRNTPRGFYCFSFVFIPSKGIHPEGFVVVFPSLPSQAKEHTVTGKAWGLSSETAVRLHSWPLLTQLHLLSTHTHTHTHTQHTRTHTHTHAHTQTHTHTQTHKHTHPANVGCMHR